MDKTAIRNFAIEARKTLMKSAITEAGFYGITKDGCKDPVQKGNDFEVYETVAGTENRIFGDDIKRRANLVQAINTLGFEQVIEETAYTWFNRIIAIRFMEVNNYLPTRVRVLSSETGSGTPDIITQADTVELNLTSDELEKIQTAKRENRYDDAFRMLVIKQCNELNAILPGLFEKTDDYMELLLKITYTGDGVIRMLVDSIPEDNFNVETEGQVEIIGWMYQYYNTELKDDTFAKLKKNVKITKERIPAATQLFTPDWIVRYMVENSLGRVWIEHLRAVNPSVDEKAKVEEFGWKYYLPEAEQEDEVHTQLVEIRKSYKDLTPQDITCIDPCMGSGHILVYMFDVLMDIYRSEGFSEREAVFDILEKNIRGLDIDRRAYQLSYFALMMKARGYNRIFFRGHEDIDGNRVQVVPRVYAIEESNTISRDYLKFYGDGLNEVEKNNAINQMNGLLDALKDAKEYGSILNIESYDWSLLRRFADKLDDAGQMSLVGFAAGQIQPVLKALINIGVLLSGKYDAVITNPPYMGASGMSSKLLQHVKDNYPDSKSDLFAVFIEKALRLTNARGFFAMITQHSWMYLDSYKGLREKLLKCQILNMAHLGARAFEEINGEVVQTTSFVFRPFECEKNIGLYVRLMDEMTQDEKEQAFLLGQNRYTCEKKLYSEIPGNPIAYRVSSTKKNNYIGNKLIGDVAHVKKGMFTGKNDLFFRTWYEVEWNSIMFNVDSKEEVISKHYVPMNSGGTYRRWYGNRVSVIKFDKEHYDIITKNKGHRNPQFYFKPAATWTKITTGRFSIRLSEQGFINNDASMAIYQKDKPIEVLVGILNSKVGQFYLSLVNETLNYTSGNVASVPYCVKDENRIVEIVKRCKEISKDEWDSYETSWDFNRNPLVGKWERIEDAYNSWSDLCENRIREMKNLEVELNKILIQDYLLDDIITPDLTDEDITLRKADLRESIINLISYAVGCMFGRYSLEKDGLVTELLEKNEFQVDVDGIIPICDEKYLDDDICERFFDFIKQVYGEKYFEENIGYIAKALSSKSGNARDIIRNYFLNEFYKDHCSMYSTNSTGKRPIYWLFDSGKQNGFKCLIYIHRYNKDIIGRIRTDYLVKIQAAIENALKNAEYSISTTESAVDRAGATKKRDKYIKQLAEIKTYYQALSHVAQQRVELDLNDGIKANHAKFQGIEISSEGTKKQKIDLLAKI